MAAITLRSDVICCGVFLHSSASRKPSFYDHYTLSFEGSSSRSWGEHLFIPFLSLEWPITTDQMSNSTYPIKLYLPLSCKTEVWMHVVFLCAVCSIISFNVWKRVSTLSKWAVMDAAPSSMWFDIVPRFTSLPPSVRVGDSNEFLQFPSGWFLHKKMGFTGTPSNQRVKAQFFLQALILPIF